MTESRAPALCDCGSYGMCHRAKTITDSGRFPYIHLVWLQRPKLPGLLWIKLTMWLRDGLRWESVLHLACRNETGDVCRHLSSELPLSCYLAGTCWRRNERGLRTNQASETSGSTNIYSQSSWTMSTLGESLQIFQSPQMVAWTFWLYAASTNKVQL